MTDSPSACRHDMSEQSTLTLKVLHKWHPCGSWSLGCWVCGCRVEFAVEQGESYSLSPVKALYRNASFKLDPVAPSNSSPTDSSSSPAERTPVAPATSGKADCPTTSPSCQLIPFNARWTHWLHVSEFPSQWRIEGLMHDRGWIVLPNLPKTLQPFAIRITHLSTGWSDEAGFRDLHQLVPSLFTAPGRQNIQGTQGQLSASTGGRAPEDTP